MKARIGTFACGFDQYWPRFPGLREELKAYLEDFESDLARLHADIVSAGMVDNVAAGKRAGECFARNRVDLVFCDVTTYVPPSAVLQVMKRCNAPVVLVGLQPTPGLDPATATMHKQLANDNCTSMPELAFAARRSNTPVADVLFGMLRDDGRVWSKLHEWVDAARTARTLREANIGFLGHAFEGMIDMYADPGLLEAAFGLTTEMVEMCDLKKCINRVTDEETAEMLARIHDYFVFPEPGADPIAGPIRPESLAWSAQVAAGLERFIEEFRLDGLACYYRGVDDNEFQRIIPAMIVGSSLLTGRGVPVAGEGDLKNTVTMLIMDRLNSGGSFAEFQPANFNNDSVLVGHEGPGHIAVSDEKPA